MLKNAGVGIFSERSDRSRCLPKSRILVVLDALCTSVRFCVQKVFYVGVWLGVKLVEWFIGILIFSELHDRSRCLPKSRNLVIFVKSVPVGLGPVFGKAEYLK